MVLYSGKLKINQGMPKKKEGLTKVKSLNFCLGLIGIGAVNQKTLGNKELGRKPRALLK